MLNFPAEKMYKIVDGCLCRIGIRPRGITHKVCRKKREWSSGNIQYRKVDFVFVEILHITGISIINKLCLNSICKYE